MFAKSGRLLKYGFKSDCQEEFQKNISEVKLPIEDSGQLLLIIKLVSIGTTFSS